MTHEEMEELARAAAHQAIISVGMPNEESAVDHYLNAYEYAMKKLYEKQQQAQAEANKYAPKTSDDYINRGRSLQKDLFKQ